MSRAGNYQSDLNDDKWRREYLQKFYERSIKAETDWIESLKNNVERLVAKSRIIRDS